MLGSGEYAYRLAWEEVNGPLEPGIILHHLCGNPWCINLDHLEPMTQGEHLRRHGNSGDNHQADKTHCPAGHPYDVANTYHHTRKDGARERHCRACRYAAKKRSRARRRAAGLPVT